MSSKASSTQQADTAIHHISAHTIRNFWHELRVRLWSGRLLPQLYLAVTLAAILLICFTVPPMQTIDESRHFVRACQIAQGDWRSTIDPSTGKGGGVLPEAVAQFVRHWMDTEALQSQDALQSITARISALDRAARRQPPLSRTKFVEFPSAGIYPPVLYLPQSVGIALARLFTDRVYVWFYSARLFNAFCAVALVFVALRIAPQYQLILMVPAALPMALTQIASISTDASIIGLSVLFVALCIRFIAEDGLLLRAGLVLCLFALTLGKPVHIPLALLLLAAYKRLGWRRAMSFCLLSIGVALLSYFVWLRLNTAFIAIAGEGHGQNPTEQVRFITMHPLSFLSVILATAKASGVFVIKEIVGLLGWEALALPVWFYIATVIVAIIIGAVVVTNWREIELSRFILAALAGIGVSAGVLLAAYILWTRPHYPTIILLEGRYFLPAVVLIAFFAPPASRFNELARAAVAISSIACLLMSAYVTVRILHHYYFPESQLTGRNLQEFFRETVGSSCPAFVQSEITGWFDVVVTGKVADPKNYHVVVTTQDGTVLGVSDPALTGADFPYSLLPGSSRARWRVHIWYVNRFENAHLWLVRDGSACSFGPAIEFKPVPMPDA